MGSLIKVMHKRRRSFKYYGSGSGRTGYQSANFASTIWYLRNGIVTDLDFKYGKYRELSIRLLGAVVFTTDEDCLTQFNTKEIIKVLAYVREDGFRQGREAKALAICKELGIR